MEIPQVCPIKKIPIYTGSREFIKITGWKPFVPGEGDCKSCVFWDNKCNWSIEREQQLNNETEELINKINKKYESLNYRRNW